MKAKIGKVIITYPEDMQELQERYTKSVAKVLIDLFSIDELKLIIEKLPDKKILYEENS
jgi:hypothetical protein